MSLQQKKEIFEDNIKDINKVTLRVSLLTNIATALLFIFSRLKIFSVGDRLCLILFLYSITTSIITCLFQFLAKKYPSYDLLVTCASLLSIEGFIVLAGASASIGIYATFSLIPFITSLYYNKRLTVIVDIASYLLMLFSLYIKWKNGASIFINSQGYTEFMATYFPVALGFTIEYSVVFVVSVLITGRNYKVVGNLVNSVEKIKASHKEVEEKNEQLEDTQLKIIEFVAECLGSHDLFTGRHVVHTKEFVNIICKKMRELGYYEIELSDDVISLYTNAAFLHDIGKIHIPEGILNKIGKFTDEEFERMKSHPAEGRKLLEFLPKIGDGKFNEIAVEMAYCHHEKWNGTGYPRKLAKEDIPLCARIMAAADVLDALISQRLYKEPMSVDQAMKVFEESKGTHFEPCIAEAVIACKNQIEIIDKNFKCEESAVYNEELQWWSSYHQNK